MLSALDRVKEAKKYRRLKDWYVNSHGSLKAAKSLGIFKLASSHMKMKKINELLTHYKLIRRIFYMILSYFIFLCGIILVINHL